ncbi:MAG: NAD(P)-dependent oxidoreductase [Rhodospirillales bacterium]|jgi:3-hydroxyisobutyrate dehydrogenase|nr:NAD(P)-dependent oxidoreductase [Rhodospirillales bacterium]MDP6645282.1 NAD(P)-dependent oxidoreductase [Rhodospirillales bacterium]MDP6842755.1 NAD(P)-dependent oxidoreductase [Rhodospirillales bacterium]
MGETVGVVGLGIMGSAFARNLMSAGMEVVGYDIDEARLKMLAADGVAAAASPLAVAEAAAVVITSLPSPAAFHSVMTGPGGIIECGRDGLVVIDTCTLSIEDKNAAFDALAAKGITLLDCPVSGTGAQAADGDLAVLASGDRQAYQAALPVLKGISRSQNFIGPFGDGSKMKYIANLLVAIHNVSAAEAMVLGLKSGLDPQLLYDVLTDSAGNSRMFEMRGPMMVANDYDSQVTATMKIQDKDMGIINQYIDGLDCPAPLFKSTIDLYRAALEGGFENSDSGSVCAVLEKIAGIER